MKAVVTPLLTSLFMVASCQSLPDSQTLPTSTEGKDRNIVFLSAQHCLNEHMRDLDMVHFGPCLKVTSVDGKPPQARDDGFIELPVAKSITLGTSCVYRHADGSPIPATMETTDFNVTPQMFTKPGARWYLHAHKQARQVTGCEPTLSRSTKPTQATD